MDGDGANWNLELGGFRLARTALSVRPGRSTESSAHRFELLVEARIHRVSATPQSL